MRHIDWISEYTKSIHFPIIKAVHEPARDKSLWKRVKDFVVYRRKFEIMQDYILWCPSLEQYIFLPSGFIYDGASVPKILNGIFNPTGMLLLGAAPHDFGYRYGGLFIPGTYSGDLAFIGFSKVQLDDLFKELCGWESGMKVASRVATITLSFFGFFSWNKHRKSDKDVKSDYSDLFVPV